MKKFLVICLLATVTLAYADNSKLSPDLQASKASHAVVIVQYNQQPVLLDLANLTNLLGTILRWDRRRPAAGQYSFAVESGECEIHQLEPLDESHAEQCRARD
jgi:hypothetical protein